MPLIRVFISPDEIYPGREVSYEQLARIATTLNRAETLHFLGYLNLLLSAATTETEITGTLQPIRDVQTLLFSEVVSEQLLADLKTKFRDASLLDRPILHRTQLLFAIRLVATHGDAVGGNTLTVRRDFDVIGDLLFLTNGLFRAEPSPTPVNTALSVATEMAPLYETENPPDINLTWPRTEELFTERLPQAATDPAELERLEQVTVFTTGFSIRAWLDLSWALFSFWAAVPFRDLMQNRGRGYLDPNGTQTVVSPETLRRAVEGLSVRFDQLPEYLRIDSYSRAILFDLTPFRAQPIWIMPDGVALCVDAALLMERFGPHAFWSVMNALDTSDRRRQFSGTWGLAFERYCNEAFRAIFVAKTWSFVSNPVDTSTNDELADGVATRKGRTILIECKGTFVTTADKYSGKRSRFMRGLTKKFGNVKHGGIYQLVRAISNVWIRRVAADSVTRSAETRDVFPILVLQDPIGASGPVGRVLVDRFGVALARATRGAFGKLPTIWPLTVITADDVDRLRAAATLEGQIAIDALLKRFHRVNPSHMISFGEFLSSRHAGDFPSPAKLQTILTARFKSKTEGTLQRFESGEYGGHAGE